MPWAWTVSAGHDSGLIPGTSAQTIPFQTPTWNGLTSPAGANVALMVVQKDFNGGQYLATGKDVVVSSSVGTWAHLLEGWYGNVPGVGSGPFHRWKLFTCNSLVAADAASGIQITGNPLSSGSPDFAWAWITLWDPFTGNSAGVAVTASEDLVAATSRTVTAVQGLTTRNRRVFVLFGAATTPSTVTGEFSGSLASDSTGLPYVLLSTPGLAALSGVFGTFNSVKAAFAAISVPASGDGLIGSDPGFALAPSFTNTLVTLAPFVPGALALAPGVEGLNGANANDHGNPDFGVGAVGGGVQIN